MRNAKTKPSNTVMVTLDTMLTAVLEPNSSEAAWLRAAIPANTILPEALWAQLEDYMTSNGYAEAQLVQVKQVLSAFPTEPVTKCDAAATMNLFIQLSDSDDFIDIRTASIAAQAIERDMTVVAASTSAISRIPGVQTVSWSEAKPGEDTGRTARDASEDDKPIFFAAKKMQLGEDG